MEINGIIISNGKAIGVRCRNAWGEVNAFVGTIVHFNNNPQQTLGGGIICIKYLVGSFPQKEVTICFCRSDIVELVEFWCMDNREKWLKEQETK